MVFGRMLPNHPRKPNQSVLTERSLHNLQDLTAPHVLAFSYAVTEGFNQLRLPVQEFELPNDVDSTHVVKLYFDPGSLTLAPPMVDGKPLYPRECRGKTKLNVTYASVNPILTIFLQNEVWIMEGNCQRR